MASIRQGAVALFLGAFTLAGCTTSVPNDVAQGVGFQDYQQWQARRAQLRGESLVVPQTVRPPLPRATAALPSPPSAPIPPAAPAGAAPATDVTRIAAAAIAASEAPVQAPAPIPAALAPPPPAPQAALAPTPVPTPAPSSLATQMAAAAPAPANPGMSDEQDFDAVAARESIESDAERLARMQAERVVIAPTALPDRPEGIGPNIIDYALATTHAVGERQHTRRPIPQARHERACLGFRSADLAQEWFLQNGGPGRDRQGLDPDGDGFACDWNPALYRAAAAARN